jgi:hypothetical protein
MGEYSLSTAERGVALTKASSLRSTRSFPGRRCGAAVFEGEQQQILQLARSNPTSCAQISKRLVAYKTWGFPSQFINQPRGLWPHYKSAALGITPERVSNPEPLDSRPGV